VLVSFVYLVAFLPVRALVLLLARGDGSKELELLVSAPRAVDPAEADAAATADGQRPAAAGGAEPVDTSAFVARVLRHARDAAALAPADRRAPVDVPAQAAGSAADRPRSARADRLAQENGH
jgi:hypothetical protein